MRILWFVNPQLPAVAAHFGRSASGSGWWLSALAERLAQKQNIQLTIAHCDHHYERREKFSAEGIDYLLIPANRWQSLGFGLKSIIQELARTVREENPDIVDVRGTEFFYGQVAALIDTPVLVTIQGIVNAVAAASIGNLSSLQKLCQRLRGGKTLEILTSSLYTAITIRARSRSERRVFACNRYFAGRTAWDREMTRRMSPHLRGYFTCGEILREPFYNHAWSADPGREPVLFAFGRCEPYKGFHDLIRLTAMLKAEFPRMRLRIGGGCTLHDWGGHLRRLVQTLGVTDHVEFLEYLSPEQIVAELLASSAYVHPSYVDNSPNSLGEAMCLGVPCIASTTGGIPSMIRHGHDGLLFETGNLASAAERIQSLLRDPALAERLGRNALATARARHDPETILQQTLEAYRCTREDGTGICSAGVPERKTAVPS